MDVTPTYIKMCEQATEIQMQAPFGVNDTRRSLIYEGDNVWFSFSAGMVWLPRQNQLHEMLPQWHARSGFVPYFADKIADFVCGIYPYPFPFDTFEQSLLALIMFSNYHKTWNGEVWIGIAAGTSCE